MFKLEPMEPSTEIKPVAIVVGGKIVGEVKPCQFTAGIRMYASIDLGKPGYAYLIQGFSDTAEAAVLDAITRGHQEIESHTRLLAEFETLINEKE